MASNRNVVHVKVTRLNKDGKRETILQAFEIVNGIRQPISKLDKQTTLNEKHKDIAARPKFKARKKPFKIQEK